MEYRIIAYIKPTKKNRELVNKRGLYSSDEQWYFDLFECMFNSQVYELVDNKDNKYKFEKLLKIGLTW